MAQIFKQSFIILYLGIIKGERGLSCAITELRRRRSELRIYANYAIK